MSPLEIALIILVSVWTLIFFIIAIALIILVINLKKIMVRVNNIVKNADDAVGEVTEATKKASWEISNGITFVGWATLKKILTKLKIVS